MDMFGLFHNLIDKPVYLIDTLPRQVPPDRSGAYAVFEAYWREREGRRFCGKVIRLLLKLSCYYDFALFSCRYGVETEPPGMTEEWEENPSPETLVRIVETCALGTPKGYWNLALNGKESMLTLDGEDPYLTVYGPDARLRELLCDLAASEGLFFRPAPEDMPAPKESLYEGGTQPWRR